MLALRVLMTVSPPKRKEKQHRTNQVLRKRLAEASPEAAPDSYNSLPGGTSTFIPRHDSLSSSTDISPGRTFQASSNQSNDRPDAGSALTSKNRPTDQNPQHGRQAGLLKGTDVIPLDRTAAWPSSFLSYDCAGYATRLNLQSLP